MRLRFLAASFAAGITTLHLDGAYALQRAGGAQATEVRIPVGNASLYARVVGSGEPLIVLHGGPDFDHGYLLPDLDRLQDAFRLIYYDQRGRGQSADDVHATDASLASDLDDLDRVKQYFRLDAAALLGHSWGAVLAVEYALRHQLAAGNGAQERRRGLLEQEQWVLFVVAHQMFLIGGR